MSSPDDHADTRCPHCGHETEVPRQAVRPLPGSLSIDEFEALVRAEWRRRLGADSYGRSHPGALIRSLVASETGEGDAERLVDAVEQVMADLRSIGAGREQIRHELAVLARSIRTVLRNAGMSAAEAEAFVEPLRQRLEDVLGWPDPTDPFWPDDTMSEVPAEV